MTASLHRPLIWVIQGWLVLCMLLPRGQLSLQITYNCDTEKQYEHLGKCCMKCEPGKYMSAKCTATSETICLPCGPNQYLDVWNEEEKCLLQKPCDSGKALVEVSSGNSTLQRECACSQGYHWNADYEFCTRNTKCGPGFGVEQPPRKDRDTVCQPCAVGQFSNISSSVQKCQPWTNCTVLGKVEKTAGTNFSDAICDEYNSSEVTKKPLEGQDPLFHMLILLLLFAPVALASVVILICCRKKVKTLSANLQHWVNEFCSRGDKEKSCCGSFHNAHSKNSGLQLSEGVFLLTMDEKCFSEQDLCCSDRHVLRGDVSLETSHSESGEDASLSSVTDSEEDQPRRIPTEDEYVDRGQRRAIWYAATAGQLGCKPAPPFSEPLEVGENDRFSQCFTGTESIFDSDGCQSSWRSCAAECAHDSAFSSVQVACTCSRMLHDVQGRTEAPSAITLGICNFCEALASDCPRNKVAHTDIGNSITRELSEHEHSPECSYDSACMPTDQNTSAGCAGENPLFDSTNTSHPSTKRSTSEASGASNCWSSETPTPSGSVTGNSNSTFISSGQVMNFKGDIIVVYVSQNSQEAPTGTGANVENVGNPVQEENQSCPDSFVGNTQQSKAKCAQASVEEEVQSELLVNTMILGPVVQEETAGGQTTLQSSQSVAVLPVQEEGKPDPFLQ